MFSLFTGKISGVLSLAFQGISKAVGLVVETVSNVIDGVVETLGAITNPITEQLTQLPVVGDTVDAVLDLKSNILNNLGNGLDAIASDLSQGDLLGGVTTALNGVTSTVGQTMTDTADVLQQVSGLASPITGLISDLPGLEGILNAANQTTSNLIGFVAETGQYVGSINPTELVSGLLSDPTASLGGVVQDASGTLENLLNDLVPVTDVVSELPVLGDVVSQVGQTVQGINQGIYDLGTQISQIDLLNPLNQNQPYV